MQHSDDSGDPQQFYARLVNLQQQHEQAASGPAQQEPEDNASLQWMAPAREHQQQLPGHHYAGSGNDGDRSFTQPSAATDTLQVPWAPVRFSSKTHILDPNTGILSLAPKASGPTSTAAAAEAAATAAPASARHNTTHHQQQSSQQLQAQPQPLHPTAPSHTASTKRPIDRSNLGYKLLSKAGWREGQGLGAQQQGMAAPLPAAYHKGSTGLGFASSQQQHSQPPPQQPPEQSAAAAGPAAGPVLGSKRLAALVASELAAEDLDTKVRRHKQLRAQEAKDKRDKAIQSYMYRAFNEVEAPNSHPLLAKSNRLTATNPLLD